MRLRRLLPLCLTLLVVTVAAPAAADLTDPPDRPPLSRSIVCPVLYAHEVVSQPILRRMVSGLLAAGYHPQSLAAVDDAMSLVSEPPPGCLVLTFDDGLLSQYTNALPVLTELGVPAVFFVLPGFADGVHRYMNNAQLRALAQAGFEVENHTCNHPLLPQLARRNLDAFFAEMQDCKRVIEDISGQTVDYVAYPSGAFDATVLEAAARFGYRAGFTTRSSAVLNPATPYALPRIRYDPSELPATVVRRIRGLGG
ncbi:MAG TPA: polysaccharide deacetylase family protein [Chloroflexota bacterium]|nr:polysaccharide deacetylase family protein [Chloroflexota bacterium]